MLKTNIQPETREIQPRTNTEGLVIVPFDFPDSQTFDNVIAFPSSQIEELVDSDPTPAKGIERPKAEDYLGEEFAERIGRIVTGESTITAELEERDRIEEALAKQPRVRKPKLKKMDERSDLAFKRGRVELLGRLSYKKK